MHLHYPSVVSKSRGFVVLPLCLPFWEVFANECNLLATCGAALRAERNAAHHNIYQSVNESFKQPDFLSLCFSDIAISMACGKLQQDEHHEEGAGSLMFSCGPALFEVVASMRLHRGTVIRTFFVCHRRIT